MDRNNYICTHCYKSSCSCKDYKINLGTKIPIPKLNNKSKLTNFFKTIIENKIYFLKKYKKIMTDEEFYGLKKVAEDFNLKSLSYFKDLEYKYILNNTDFSNLSLNEFKTIIKKHTNEKLEKTSIVINLLKDNRDDLLLYLLENNYTVNYDIIDNLILYNKDKILSKYLPKNNYQNKIDYYNINSIEIFKVLINNKFDVTILDKNNSNIIKVLIDDLKPEFLDFLYNKVKDIKIKTEQYYHTLNIDVGVEFLKTLKNTLNKKNIEKGEDVFKILYNNIDINLEDIIKFNIKYPSIVTLYIECLKEDLKNSTKPKDKYLKLKKINKIEQILNNETVSNTIIR